MENSDKNLKPQYIFEVSWEVCNKVGGIYTVLSTKNPALRAQLESDDKLIMIGPDVWKETSTHPDFEEDPTLFKDWRENAAMEGLYFRAGRWKIEGKPLAILVDFTPFFQKKDEIFSLLWEKFKLDSLTGQWDYIEPAMFGYASAKIIESFYKFNNLDKAEVIAHFHEWMTGTGILHLNNNTPEIATAFTTHATALGRSIAGNGLKLYSGLPEFKAENLASEFGIKSKFSLEKLSGQYADVFTTVSTITNMECKYLLDKEVDIVTPNGFDDSFVPEPEAFEKKRNTVRKKLIDVSKLLYGTDIADDTLMIINSGRYEYKNKGIDLFIRSLNELNTALSGTNRSALAVIAVPGHHLGPRQDILNTLHYDQVWNPENKAQALTHYLFNESDDPVISELKKQDFYNNKDSKVKVLFVPTYLDGNDGIFNVSYYDFLTAFDLSAFPSYYEPWGYTPLESLAFGIPTITTTLAGFGKWINDEVAEKEWGVAVIERNDTNDNDVVSGMASFFANYSELPSNEVERSRNKAIEIAGTAKWINLVSEYNKAYEIALEKCLDRTKDVYSKINVMTIDKPQVKSQAVWKKALVKAKYPQELSKLKEISLNLWWSWNEDAQELFASISPELWISTENNPIEMLSSLSLDELNKLAKDQEFLDQMNKVYDNFRSYMDQPLQGPEIAYFSMEYGLHDSLKIFSGGLGVLAGDYLKEASDSAANISGVGLLYRFGYFKQKISVLGEQIATLKAQKFSNLPIQPVRDESGEWIKIKIALPGRNLIAKVWMVEVGRVKLYLLDTDIDDNAPHDRFITHQLYGGDLENRFKQELLLGVGGIRFLREINKDVDLYHCNEGHAAFISFERLRLFVQDEKLSFNEALELVKGSTLFTTHTPVPAGHDTFPEDILRAYIPHYAERLHIKWDDLTALGRMDPDDHSEKFSMSVLAIKTSQEVNGVSEIHGEVSRKMFNPLYQGYFAREVHIGHVTNGVHYPTWAHAVWKDLHTKYLGEDLIQKQHLPDFWSKADDISDEEIWTARTLLRSQLVQHIKSRMTYDMRNRQDSPQYILKLIETLDPNALTIGFARRFATYKRAHLLFTNEERLAKLLNNEKRPVQFVFAGKAHPQDKAGQDLIKKIISFSRKPEFIGKIIFLEDYDMRLGHLLTQGCDIWLNTPTRPLEASGTSGEKAIMNGVLNFSVLDGWWAEGYNSEAGWMLPKERIFDDQYLQDQLDAESIYSTFEDDIVTAFYNRNDAGIPTLWTKYIKNNFKKISPNFTMRRMLNEYYDKYYYKLMGRREALYHDNYKVARDYATWKEHVRNAWDNIEVVKVEIPDPTTRPLELGELFMAGVELKITGLNKEDIGVEIVFAKKVNEEIVDIKSVESMDIEAIDGDIIRFTTSFPSKNAGVFDYAFRIYPKNDLMPHRMDFPLVKWA